MVVHTAIGLTEAREYYKRVQAGEKNVHLPPPLVLSGGEVDLMACPAVARGWLKILRRSILKRRG